MEKINIIRKAIVDVISKIDGNILIKLPYTPEELKELFFEKKEDKEGEYYDFNTTMYEIIKRIDLSELSFDNFNLSGIIIDGNPTVKIDPQKIYLKNFRGAILEDVEFVGENNLNEVDLFEDVILEKASIINCQNARINPQTVRNKSLREARFSNVDFTGFSFDDVDIFCANFSKSKGVVINPNTIKPSYITANLIGVEFIDLPLEMPSTTNAYEYRNFIETTNYQALLKEKDLKEQEIYEKIKDQLPKKAEVIQQKVEEEKTEPSKRKFFKF